MRLGKLGDTTQIPAVTAWNAFSHRGRVVTAEEWDVVRGNRSEKEAWQVLVDWAGLLVAFSSVLTWCVHFVPFWNECLCSFQSCLCVCAVQKIGRRCEPPFERFWRLSCLNALTQA